MSQESVNIVRAFLQGLTGAGLLRRLNYPGAPMYAIDPRSTHEILESMKCGETLVCDSGGTTKQAGDLNRAIKARAAR